MKKVSPELFTASNLQWTTVLILLRLERWAGGAVVALSRTPDSLRTVNWTWRKRGEPAPMPEPERGSRYSAAALETFLEHARALAAWHEARADAFERKASTLLGFVGVILVLLPTLRAPIAKSEGPCIRTFLVGLAIATAVLLALTALASAMVLKPRPYTAPSLPQLLSEWTAYAKHGQAHRTPEHLIGLFVDQYIRRTDPKSSPVQTLRDDVETRAWWMKCATWLVLLGVFALAALTSTLLVVGGV